jgi:tetratricopeptide (TPR) repeat protein
MSTQPTNLSKRSSQQNFPIRIFWGVLIVILITFAGALGALAGYQNGMSRVSNVQSGDNSGIIQEQFELGIQDYEAGRYDLARQRFEYVIAMSPDDYPLAWNLLGEILTIQNSTATFTALPPTFTPSPTITITPTHDLSGADSIFTRALSLMAAGDWNAAIEAFIVLRNEELYYRVVEVDDQIYAALRNRGEQKILAQGDLEGGIYDLTLAEKFGPLDYNASVYRDWARLYLSALGYWEAYPEQAVNLFGQIAAALPGLRDGSGWTAGERYRQSLIHYGDQLAAEEQWCQAQIQYELALAIRQIEGVALTLTKVAHICSPPTQTFTPSPAPSGTATITFTPTVGPSPTATSTGAVVPPTATASNTVLVAPSETPTPEPSATSQIASETPTSLPTATNTTMPAPTNTHTTVPAPTDTQTTIPTETPSPIPTETATTP